MAKLIPPQGKVLEVFPKNKKSFKLEELYALVRCETVELVSLADGSLMWLDEDGKTSNKPINHYATRLLAQAGGIFGDYVQGNVLITSRKEGGS